MLIGTRCARAPPRVGLTVFDIYSCKLSAEMSTGLLIICFRNVKCYLRQQSANSCYFNLLSSVVFAILLVLKEESKDITLFNHHYLFANFSLKPSLINLSHKQTTQKSIFCTDLCS